LLQDLFEHGLQLRQYIVVPEPEHAKAVLPQNGGTAFVVVRSLSMLTAIEFNDEPRFQADKINDETGDRQLTPELELTEAP
jgi:hypothetical protein